MSLVGGHTQDMRWEYWVVSMIAACGARSEISGSNESSDASGLVYDAGLVDVAIQGDGAGGIDAGTVDACTPTVTQVACGGPKNSDCPTCKFDFEWMCGDVKHRIGGECTPAEAGVPSAGAYEGACDENGQQTSTFNVPTVTCDCTDASALLTIVQAQCTHQ
jgi:hypothetical protein